MNGTKQVAQRIVNAEEAFIAVIVEKGFTPEEAVKAMRTLLRLKAAKLDPIIGRISVSHGMYLEADVLRNAVNLAN